MPPVVLRMPPGFSPNTPICLFACLCVCICRKWAVEGNRAGDCLSKAPDTLWGKESSRWSWQVSLGSYSLPQRASEHPSSSCSPSIEAHPVLSPHSGSHAVVHARPQPAHFRPEAPLAGPAEPGWSPAASSPLQRLVKRSKRHTEKRAETSTAVPGLCSLLLSPGLSRDSGRFLKGSGSSWMEKS